MIKRVITWFEKHNIISLIITIIIAFVIFYLSSIPGSGYPSGLGIITKIYHIVIFFLLSLFLLLAIVKGKFKNKYFTIVAILIALLYATTDEIHQFFVPGRNPAVNDVLIDSLGILVAGIFYSVRLRISLHKRKPNKLPIMI
jgi:VanZ family protein